jgi:hypothetical protein
MSDLNLTSVPARDRRSDKHSGGPVSVTRALCLNAEGPIR